jgi:hypothetical protein
VETKANVAGFESINGVVAPNAIACPHKVSSFSSITHVGLSMPELFEQSNRNRYEVEKVCVIAFQKKK